MTATPGAGNNTVALASRAIRKIPGYPSTANCSTRLRMLNTKTVIAITANKASTRKTFVRKLVFFRSLTTVGGIACGSGDRWTFEGRTDDWSVFFCARCSFRDVLRLFTFFDVDMLDLCSWCIDIAWIAFRDGHEHIFALYQLTEDCVPIIEVRCRSMCDKELRTVCIRSGVCHREHTPLAMPQAGMKFICKFIARSASSGTSGVATLHHEIGNHAMEHHAIIESFAREKDKVVDCLWCFICEQFKDHCAFIGFHARLVFLLGINLQLWWFRPLFCH